MAKSRKSFLVLVASLLLGGFAYADDWQNQAIGPFGVLNNADSSFAIPADKAQDLLNVNITQGGKSVVKRKGYGISATLSITTSPVHGTYTFFDSNGNTVDLYFNDSRMSSSINGGSTSVLFSTGPNGATYQCTDAIGFAYCANTNRNTVVKTNGSTYSLLNTVASTGTMVTACPTRLATAGFASNPSRIDFSADSDFTTWGTGSLGTSACQFTINAPGPAITHITYAFGRLMWFKNSSFGYILMGVQPFQSDWVIRTVSYDVGTNDNSSVYREGILYFRGQDGHIYGFDGTTYNRLSRDISGSISQSQTRTGNFWTQTTQSDFASGAQNPVNWLSTSTYSGSIVLASTAASPSSFTDTTSADFALGTLASVSTATANTLRLSFDTYNLHASFYPGANDSNCSNVCLGPYYSSRRVLVTGNSLLSDVLIRLIKVGSPGDFTLKFMSDSSGLPGTELDSISVPAASITTSTGDYTVHFSSNIALTSGTSYWIQMAPGGTCDSSNNLRWVGTGGAGGSTGTIACGAGLTSGAFPALSYKLFTTSYVASGQFVSNSFDIGFSSSSWIPVWGTFLPNNYTPTNTTLNFFTQSSTSNVSSGPTWSTVASVSSGATITSPSKQYIRYRAEFTTTNGSTSPIINDVTLNVTRLLRPGATYFSAVNNAPLLTLWDTLGVTKQNNGGTHSLSIRSSTNPITVTSSTPSWTSINSGAIPSISTAPYFQIADFIEFSTNSQVTDYGPKLDDFTQNWFEGNATDKAYATYFDDKIWWSVALGTGTSTNNRVLLLDLLNQGWSIYSLPVNGFHIRQNRLYFGSSASGYVYKFGDTENDNGAAINAYWKSKDFFGASPFTTQEIANISIIAKSVANSSMTVTYTLNGSSSTSYTMNQYNPTGSFINKNRNISAGTIGSQYNIQFGNNAADQPFEVFAIQVGIRPRNWIPTP